jgi:hypothetical protein
MPRGRGGKIEWRDVVCPAAFPDAFATSGVGLVGEQITGLAIEYVAELLESSEPDRFCPTRLQYRKVLRSDADLFGDRIESDFAFGQHHIEIYDNRHDFRSLNNEILFFAQLATDIHDPGEENDNST